MNKLGHYVAILEDKDYNQSLGVDAMNCGNEMRFINSYLNISSRANVKMRTAYINTYPHIIVICIEDIEIDEEILLDYGEEYTNMYLKPPDLHDSNPVSWNKLPFGSSTESSSTDSDKDKDREEDDKEEEEIKQKKDSPQQIEENLS